MGRLCFYVTADKQPPPDWERTQLLTADGLPYQIRCKWDSPHLIIERPETDSAILTAIWSSAQYGRLALTTGTLLERDIVYNLSRELARGTLNRLRNQTALWQSAGLVLPDEYHALHKSAVQWLSKSAVCDDDQEAATRYGQLSLELSLQGIAVLTAAYAKQAYENRRRTTNKQINLIGATLVDPPADCKGLPPLLEACNSIAVPFSWKRIESKEGRFAWAQPDQMIAWAQAHQQRVCAGPLIDFTTEALPEWLVLWEDDFDSLLTMTTEYVQRAAQRYKGRIQLWNAAAKVNTMPALRFGDEQRLRLTARIIETLRRIDPRTPIIVTLDQPAGEGLAENGGDVTPLQFADALLRADLGLAGIGLEYQIGLQPGRSLPRDPLAFCQQLDQWMLLNAAALLFIEYAPTGPHAAPHQQAEWLHDYGPVILGKQIVQGLFWNRTVDPAEIAANQCGPGLLSSTGEPKPIVAELKTLKQRYGA